MNFDTTSQILEAIAEYTVNSDITVDTGNKGFTSHKSDLVMIDKANNVGFEVLENEIIVYYFTEHTHFEDYSAELAEGQDDYIKRAKDFLITLLSERVLRIMFFKGKAMVKEKYYIYYHDGREDEYVGGTFYSIIKSLNPFAKKHTKSITWIFDKEKGRFTNRDLKRPHAEAATVIDINDDCYIEISEFRGTYSYEVIEIDYDDYFGMYYWAPAVNIIPSGIYDKKEKAIEEAMYAINARKRIIEEE